jgi:hypothetical protein
VIAWAKRHHRLLWAIAFGLYGYFVAAGHGEAPA